MGTPQESRYLSTRDEVAAVFRFFRDQQSEIKLRFNSDKFGAQSFTARVLDVTEQQILLQNIIPLDGVRHLRSGESFSISGRADGLFVYISDNQALPEPAKTKTPVRNCVAIALPTTVLYQQRRRSERVRLPTQNAGRRSHIRLGDIAPLYGRILDISSFGAKIQIDPARKDCIRKDQRLESCQVHVPNQLSINVSYIVRRAIFNDEQNTMTCGLELLKTSTGEQAQLDAFVSKINNHSI